MMARSQLRWFLVLAGVVVVWPATGHASRRTPQQHAEALLKRSQVPRLRLAVQGRGLVPIGERRTPDYSYQNTIWSTPVATEQRTRLYFNGDGLWIGTARVFSHNNEPLNGERLEPVTSPEALAGITEIWSRSGKRGPVSAQSLDTLVRAHVGAPREIADRRTRAAAVLERIASRPKRLASLEKPVMVGLRELPDPYDGKRVILETVSLTSGGVVLEREWVFRRNHQRWPEDAYERHVLTPAQARDLLLMGKELDQRPVYGAQPVNARFISRLRAR
jgi:hypothetical protein